MLPSGARARVAIGCSALIMAIQERCIASALQSSPPPKSSGAFRTCSRRVYANPPCAGPSIGGSSFPGDHYHKVSKGRRSLPQILQRAQYQNNDSSSVAGNGARFAVAERTETKLAELRREVSELRRLVAAQGQLVQQQMATISELRGALETEEAAPTSNSWSGSVNPFEAQRAAIGDRRYLGMYDARFHSTTWGATPKDFRVLPKRIILVRHAESEGNIDNFAYTYVPDPQVPLTERGIGQAKAAGQRIKDVMTREEEDFKLYFYMSPYKRSQQTFEALVSNFHRDQVQGCQEEVQLREQDFGNFQDVEGKQREKAERLRFGRFFYRFPNGESGADVYDRMTIFEDHMIRDINAGRFGNNTSLVLVTHGLALRVFLMRWFHWSVDQFLDVYNPPNAEPLVMERVADHSSSLPGELSWIHTKALYRLTDESRDIIKGCTSEMCTTSCLPTGSKLLQDFPPWNSSGTLVQPPF